MYAWPVDRSVTMATNVIRFISNLRGTNDIASKRRPNRRRQRSNHTIDLTDGRRCSRVESEMPTLDDQAQWLDDSLITDNFDQKLAAFLDLDVGTQPARTWLLKDN